MKVILEVKDGPGNSVSKELGLILKGVVAGLWSISFPHIKPFHRETWIKCQNCKKWHKFQLPDR